MHTYFIRVTARVLVIVRRSSRRICFKKYCCLSKCRVFVTVASLIVSYLNIFRFFPPPPPGNVQICSPQVWSGMFYSQLNCNHSLLISRFPPSSNCSLSCFILNRVYVTLPNSETTVSDCTLSNLFTIWDNNIEFDFSFFLGVFFFLALIILTPRISHNVDIKFHPIKWHLTIFYDIF